MAAGSALRFSTAALAPRGLLEAGPRGRSRPGKTVMLELTLDEESLAEIPLGLDSSAATADHIVPLPARPGPVTLTWRARGPDACRSAPGPGHG